MTAECAKCKDIEESPADAPHLLVPCAACGRAVRTWRAGEHGRGLAIEKGDQVVIPPEWLRPSFDPLKGNTQLSRTGVDWFARQLFLGDKFERKDLAAFLERQREHLQRIWTTVPELTGIDLNSDEGQLRAHQVIKGLDGSVADAALNEDALLSAVGDARARGDLEQAVLYMAYAERFRALRIFREEIASVVWMGHSARRLVNVVAEWNRHRDNKAEEFWQQTLAENAFVLSQVFAVPLVLVKEKAYVGGMQLDRHDAKYLDFLLAVESSSDAVLIEIKTPSTTLLGGEYRGGVFPPSSELSGTIAQVLSYRATLVADVDKIDKKRQLNVLSPRCAVIVGDAGRQLDTDDKRRSFELYRRALRDVELVTFDELFRKAATLAEVFGLTVSKSA
jgi:hypothetical protein